MTDVLDLEIATVRVEDDAALARWLAVRNAVDARPLTLAGFRAELTAASEHLELLATLDGVDVGAAGTGWGAISSESKTVFLDAWVLGPERRRGIGTQLIERCVAFARDAGMSTGRSYALEGDEGAVRFAERFGLVVVGGGQMGSLELTPAHAAATTGGADGLEITTLAERPDLERAAYELDVLVQPEIPTLALEPTPSFEAWHTQTAGDPGFVPELSVIALRDDRVVGSILIFDNAEGVAFIGMTAVHPDARRQGIARALKAELAARAARTGWRRLETYNDGTNERMRGLNIELGYTYQPRHVSLKGPLPTADVSSGD